MGYSPSDVVKLIKEKDIKFIDFRFTDTKGKEQHVSVPGHTIEKDTFVDGKAFEQHIEAMITSKP